MRYSSTEVDFSLSRSPKSATSILLEAGDGEYQNLITFPSLLQTRSLRTSGITNTTQKPLKGILKAPSLTSFSAKPSSLKKPVRRIQTDGGVDYKPEQHDDKANSFRQRTVSFSDCGRWKNQASSPSLNRMPHRSSDLTANAMPPLRSPSGQGNHIWTPKSQSSQPPDLPKRTKESVRKPSRRGSNEFQQQSSSMSGNVFQNSVDSFLNNARPPAQPPSSTPAIGKAA